jgi:dUTP pyrophosphatase
MIKIKLLNENAKVPTYATVGAACFDIYAAEGNDILGGEQAAISTGLAFDLPEGKALMVYSRSGHGFKHGVRLGNVVGVIDSDYRGELKICLRNDGGSIFSVRAGDRIAQGMIIDVERYEFESVEELSETVRGDGGFGSTGK